MDSSRIDPSSGIFYLLVLALRDKIELPIHHQQRQPPRIYLNGNIILPFRKTQRDIRLSQTQQTHETKLEHIHRENQMKQEPQPTKKISYSAMTEE